MFKIGSVIVVLGILVLGGLYFWGYFVNKDGTMHTDTMTDDILPEGFEDVTNTPGAAVDEALEQVADSVADQLGSQGTSNKIGDIEADLNASDLGDVNLDDIGF